MNFTVYVPDEMGRRIRRDKSLKLSRIFQRAIQREWKRRDYEEAKTAFLHDLKELKRRDSNKEKQT